MSLLSILAGESGKFRSICGPSGSLQPRSAEVRGQMKVGDVVQLKSGGPRMTVVEVKPEGITCQWYSKEDEDYKSGIFAPDALKPYVSSRPRVGGDRGLRGY